MHLKSVQFYCDTCKSDTPGWWLTVSRQFPCDVCNMLLAKWVHVDVSSSDDSKTNGWKR